MCIRRQKIDWLWPLWELSLLEDEAWPPAEVGPHNNG